MLAYVILVGVSDFLGKGEHLAFRLVSRRWNQIIAQSVFEKEVIKFEEDEERPVSLLKYNKHIRILVWDSVFKHVRECPRVDRLTYYENPTYNISNFLEACKILRNLKALHFLYERPEFLSNLGSVFSNLVYLRLTSRNPTSVATGIIEIQQLSCQSLKHFEVPINFFAKAADLLVDIEDRMPKLRTIHIFQVIGQVEFTMLHFDFGTRQVASLGVSTFGEVISLVFCKNSPTPLRLEEGRPLARHYENLVESFLNQESFKSQETFPEVEEFFCFKARINPLIVLADASLIKKPHLPQVAFGAKKVKLLSPDYYLETFFKLAKKFVHMQVLEISVGDRLLLLTNPSPFGRPLNIGEWVFCGIHHVLEVSTNLTTLYSDLRENEVEILQKSYPKVTFKKYSPRRFRNPLVIYPELSRY